MSSSEPDAEANRARLAREVDYGELPEFARGLRALGSARRGGGGLQSQFFLPLIDARRRAAEAHGPSASVRAFNAVDLARTLDQLLERIIMAWPDRRTSARRALRAELVERVGPYSRALTQLNERAEAALAADESSRLDAWRAWTAQLLATFEAADRSWIALGPAVETLRMHEKP